MTSERFSGVKMSMGKDSRLEDTRRKTGELREEGGLTIRRRCALPEQVDDC